VNPLIIDGLVLIVYFSGIVGLGLWAGRRNRTLTEFALGGRSIPWWAILASIIAVETSAVTFLGTPIEGFKTRSFIYVQLSIGAVLGRVVVALLFIRPFYGYGVQSIYEFLNIRFGPKTKNMASAIFLVTRLLGIGVRLYMGGVIFKVVWQYLFPESSVNLNVYFYGILFITLLTTVYTAVGGIKAVVWTDLIQALLMVTSVIVSIVLLMTSIPGGWGTVCQHLGGFPPLFQLGIHAHDGLSFKHVLEEPYTLIGALFGSTFHNTAQIGTDQDYVQRLLTANHFKKSQLSLILSGLADVPIGLCFLTVGILLYVYYQVCPDPHLPKDDNEIFAYYIVSKMPVGLRGLIVAGVFATMMGSTSAALNAMATSFTKDFFLPYWNGVKTEKSAIYAARCVTVIFGTVMIGIGTFTAYMVLRNPHLTIIPIALAAAGYTYGSLLGVFMLGLLTRNRGWDAGNVMGMVAGIIAIIVFCKVDIPAINLEALTQRHEWIPQTWNLGVWLPSWWPAISWVWYVLVGAVVCFLVSCLFKTPQNKIVEKERALSGNVEKMRVN
jgi:solute:Na+ symporter, SSS family